MIIAFIHPQFRLASFSLQANMFFPPRTIIFPVISDHLRSMNTSAQSAVGKQNGMCHSPWLDLNNSKSGFGMNLWIGSKLPDTFAQLTLWVIYAEWTHPMRL